MKNISLLSTDFDGTLIDICPEGVAFPPKESCDPQLAAELEGLVQQGGIWVINTGRPLDLLLEGLEYFNAPIKPHYVITSERHIHHYHEGLKPLGDWNQRCDKRHEFLFNNSGIFFERLYQLVSEYDQEATFLETTSGVPDQLLVTDTTMLDEIASRILALPEKPADFSFQRSNIHLHFCHGFYNKGSSLSEVSRFLSIEPAHVLAIGDYHNDIAMLTGEVAAMVACPSNAHQAVKETVRKAKGHVSLHPSSRGTAEAICMYRKGKRQKKWEVS